MKSLILYIREKRNKKFIKRLKRVLDENILDCTMFVNGPVYVKNIHILGTCDCEDVSKQMQRMLDSHMIDVYARELVSKDSLSVKHN